MPLSQPHPPSPLQPLVLDWSSVAASLPRCSLLAARCHGDTVPISATYAPLLVLSPPLSTFALIAYLFRPLPHISQADQLRGPEIMTLFSAQSPQSQVPDCSLQLLLYRAPPVFPRAVSSVSSFSSFSSLLLTFTPLKQILGCAVFSPFTSRARFPRSVWGSTVLWGAFRLDGNKSLAGTDGCKS
jgi:hypothetical protein